MDKKGQNNSYIATRRGFLQNGLQLAVGIGACTVPDILLAASKLDKRSLSFYHTHTQKELSLTYAIGRRYSHKALLKINNYLGDFRTGETHPIDPQLLDILWAIQKRSRKKGIFSVISGYRSQATNECLRANSTGVARQSLHMQGKAIDVRFSELSTDQLQYYALDLRAGGVGYYPDSDFIHLDTGKYRSW